MTRSVEIPEAAVAFLAEIMKPSVGEHVGPECPAWFAKPLADCTCGVKDEVYERMHAALEATLPYLAPACQGDGICTNPRCPTHGIEWDVPAGDGGLREALEELATKYETAAGTSSYQWQSRELNALLATHPAAPAVPQPVDREALERAVRGAWDNQKFPDEITNDIVNAVLAVLAGEQGTGREVGSTLRTHENAPPARRRG